MRQQSFTIKRLAKLADSHTLEGAQEIVNAQGGNNIERAKDIPEIIEELHWSIQYPPRVTQRPFIHLLHEVGANPLCRKTPFKTSPWRQGETFSGAVDEQSKFCPRCFNLADVKIRNYMKFVVNFDFLPTCELTEPML